MNLLSSSGFSFSHRAYRRLLFALTAGLVVSGAAYAQNAPEKQAPVPPPTQGAAPSAAPAGGTAATPSPTGDRNSAYYHYGLAHLYEEAATLNGRAELAQQAIEEYKLALNADPKSGFLNSGLAELYFKLGRVREAVLAAQELLNKDANNLEAHKLLGRIYLRTLGDGNGQNSDQSAKVLNLAIAEYTKLTELEPASTENHLILGQLFAAAHDTAKAEEQFRQARQIDGNSEEVVLRMAQLYGEKGDTQRAIETLKSLPEEDRTSRSWFALGAMYDQVKQNKPAIEAYRKSLALEGDNLDAQRALAQDLLNDAQLGPALQQYQQVVAADPQDAPSLLRIAEIERSRGKYDEALAALKKAGAIAPDSDEIGFNQALVYDAMGRYDDAAKMLEAKIAGSTHSNGSYTDGEKNNLAIFVDHLGAIYREQNRTEQAVAQYRKLIALGGDYVARGYQDVIDTYRDAKMWPQATQAAEEAVAKLPNDRAMKLTLAGQLADTGKPDQGLALARAQLKGTPEDREVEVALALIYTRLRRFKEAAAELDKAEALTAKAEDKSYLYFLRGTLDERQKHYEAADADFRKVLADDPNNAAALNYLGYMYADRGIRLEEAVSMLRKAVEQEPQRYEYLDSLGWAYYKQGQYQLAEENLQKALRRNDGDPTLHDHLGEVYDKTGKIRLAAAQWQRALEEYRRSVAADLEPGDLAKVEKKLESARVRIAREDPATVGAAPKQ